MRGLIARMRSIWLGVRRRPDIEADMDEEFRLHTELRARDLERAGLPPAQAMRRARQEFGSPERFKAAGRASRGLHRIDFLRFSWLDFKVGFRMLARYPGLTVVGCMAIAVGIGMGTLYFEAINKWRHPRIPLPEGDRVVAIRNYDVMEGNPNARALYDFATWGSQLRSLTDVGAAVVFERNVITEDRQIAPVRGAEVTESAFRLTRIAPAIGRALHKPDFDPGAPLVAVLGHQLWKARFHSDPQVIGRTFEIGTNSATIVGVMPEGYGFPVAEKLWLPLRVDGSILQPATGPSVQLFGRLNDGVSAAQAQSELDAISTRMSADYQNTHKNLRLRVQPYGEPAMSQGGEAAVVRTVLYSLNAVFGLLLVIVCANVGTLVFARTATRGWEIAVRNALGASRARILSQLFVEALVLAGSAAVFGVLAAKVGLRFGIAGLSAGAHIPFWMSDDIAPLTILYAIVLTLFGAAIIGVLPALRITKPAVQASLRREGAARSGLRFGGFWTAVIVVQVAITVALMPLAAGGALQANRFQKRAESIRAERFLSAELALTPETSMTDSAAFAARARTSYDELVRRLSADPAVQVVTFANRLPGMDQFKYEIAVDTAVVPNTPDALRRSTAALIAPGFFEAFEAKIVAGRDFEPSDYELKRRVIVNQSFARLVFGGRNAIGQRIRYPSSSPAQMADSEGQKSSGEWYEIVGMVNDFMWTLDVRAEQAAIYHPLKPAGAGTINLAVRVRGDPATFAPRLRSIAVAVDPAMRLYDVTTLDKIGGGEAKMNWMLTTVAAIVSFMVLLLSATGIHSLMAFTVARRSREIGIRAALGAHPRRIVAQIFGRAFLQLSIGVLAGSLLTAMFGISSQQVMLLAGAIGVMMIVGLAACAVPLRRALRVDPTEALRMEA